MNVRLFSGQTIYLSTVKMFDNLIYKDLCVFSLLFVGQEKHGLLSFFLIGDVNIKNKSVVSTNEHNSQTKNVPKIKSRLQHFLIDLARFQQFSAVNP